MIVKIAIRMPSALLVQLAHLEKWIYRLVDAYRWLVTTTMALRNVKLVRKNAKYVETPPIALVALMVIFSSTKTVIKTVPRELSSIISVFIAKTAPMIAILAILKDA